MPIRVRLDVNGQDSSVIWITRLAGEGTNPDSLNRYMVVRGPLDIPPWRLDQKFNADEHPQFTHRYGDGREVCVAKGLTVLAMAESESDPPTWELSRKTAF